MKIGDALAALFPRTDAGPMVTGSTGPRARRRWQISAMTLAPSLLVASCIATGQTGVSRSPTAASEADGQVQTERTLTRSGTSHPMTLDPFANLEMSVVSGATEVDAADAEASRLSVHATSPAPGGRRVSLRPKNNVDAHDLLDHWGHRHNSLLSEGLSEAATPADDVDDFRELLEGAREEGTQRFAPELRDGDAVTLLGHHGGVAYGRWSGGPADTLAIDFDLQYATGTIREKGSFGAALERAGKAWSWRIEDTWGDWERWFGESKGRLIGNYNSEGREIRVGPGGEISTGLVIYVTGVELGEGIAGRGGPKSIRPGAGWEPHTGVLGLDRGFLEEASESALFATMAHEIGHVIGAWADYAAGERLDAYIDRETGTWTGPNAIAVHGGPAPFQDADDAHGWHDGQRSADAGNIDYAHSGVCSSIMAYCRTTGGIPAFKPAEIDFAFLADIGLTTRPASDRPETYGLAGWMEHSAFTLSVSRELDVSLADPQPRYSFGGGRFASLQTVDLLWAEADAFGDPSDGALSRSFPLAGTVRYSGGLVGAAVELPGFPPVHGHANLSVVLETLTGKASFTSLRTLRDGERFLFADGNLHYPIAVRDNAIVDESPGATLIADFYGPRHEEVAGTLDDSRAGLVASFGAKHDERPSRSDTIGDADHIRGMMYQNGFDEDADGWHRYRCGTGTGCEGQFVPWDAGGTWYDVTAAENRTPREQVLVWTAGWGEWMSEDMFADLGAIRISRRHAGGSDGARGRYQADGYFGTMEHAAFGTGFYSYHDWERPDGEIWDFDILGTGFQGDVSGTRPSGGATWAGRMVGYQSGLEAGEERFVQGGATVRVSFQRDRVDVGFTNVASVDFRRDLEDFGFDDIRLGSDGTFVGSDGGPVQGAFFGPAHEEVAGMFYKNDIKVIGSFGAVGRD